MNVTELINDRDFILDCAEEFLCRRADSARHKEPFHDPCEGYPTLGMKVGKFEKSLVNHLEFDLHEYLGIPGLWSLFNEELTGFLEHSPYKRVSMHIAYILLNAEIESLECQRYRPAQDYLALLHTHTDDSLAITSPQESAISAEEYVQTILQALNHIKSHLKEGYSKHLEFDLIVIHDELAGSVPDQFDSQLITLAQILFTTFRQNANINQSHYKPGLSWSQQPEQFKTAFSELMTHCSDRILEIGKKYFPDGRLEEGSLSYNYLIAHAEDAIMGNWSEEESER